MKNKGIAFLGYLILVCGILLLCVIIPKIGVFPASDESADVSGTAGESSADVSRSYIGDASGGVVADEGYRSLQLLSECAVAYNIGSHKYNLLKNAATKCAPGDFNLLMTALVALDKLENDYTFIVTNEITLVPEGAKLAGLKYGDILTVEMMLDALLVQRGADAAYAVAASVARQTDPDLSDSDAVALFVSYMNSTAASLSMSASHFTDPAGGFDDNQYTTASDICKAAVKCCDSPRIRASVTKKSASHTLQNGRGVTFTNNNKLIDNTAGKNFYTYANGMLAWSPAEGIYCMIATAKIGDNDLVAVLVSAPGENDIYTDAQSLFYPVLSEVVFSGESAS